MLTDIIPQNSEKIERESKIVVSTAETENKPLSDSLVDEKQKDDSSLKKIDENKTDNNNTDKNLKLEKDNSLINKQINVTNKQTKDVIETKKKCLKIESSSSKSNNNNNNKVSKNKKVSETQSLTITTSESNKIDETKLTEQTLNENDNEKLTDEWQEVITKRHKKNRLPGSCNFNNNDEKFSESDETENNQNENVSEKKIDW